MLDIVKFKYLIKEYKNIFNDILGDMRLDKVINGKFLFTNDINKSIIMTQRDRKLEFNYFDDQIEKNITLELPDKANRTADILVKELVKEKRKNGYIVERIEKNYGYSIIFGNDRILSDLTSERVCFNNHNDKNKLKTVFECHMISLINSASHKWYQDPPYATSTTVNGKDISKLYDSLTGFDRVSRIYDLYNGIINERNMDDIVAINLGFLNEDCFGYKEMIKIDEEENVLCGFFENPEKNNYAIEYFLEELVSEFGYRVNQLPNNITRNILLSIITYRPTVQENEIHNIEKITGMSYDEFDKLDIDEKRQLIKRNKFEKYISDLFIDKSVSLTKKYKKKNY